MHTFEHDKQNPKLLGQHGTRSLLLTQHVLRYLMHWLPSHIHYSGFSGSSTLTRACWDVLSAFLAAESCSHSRASCDSKLESLAASRALKRLVSASSGSPKLPCIQTSECEASSVCTGQQSYISSYVPGTAPRSPMLLTSLAEFPLLSALLALHLPSLSGARSFWH